MSEGNSRRRHPATWEHSLPAGYLHLSIDLPISAEDANDIEEFFEVVMRTVRRQLIESPHPATPGESA